MRSILNSVLIGIWAGLQSWTQTPGALDGRLIEATPARRPFVIEFSAGHSLQPDSDVPYRDGENGVLAFGRYALTLCTNRVTCSTLPESVPGAEAARFLVIDLRSPVQNSGASDRGVVRASAANFGAFWGQDTNRRVQYGDREGWLIRSALDIPVNTTVESERVELRFFMNGAQHVLQFGPWTAGQYQSDQGQLTGVGTIRATIRRMSATTWDVLSGPGSVGRLWDNRDPAHPIDLGLYRFTFKASFKHLSD